MTRKMLIDAAHPEEVRVCVLENNKVEDFDFEYSSRKPLRGNIYLARITRVEPSLQAAFVEYGGNRHGFLAFNEIHPDYYQIPVSDRRILQEAEAEEAALAAQLDLGQRGDEGEDGEIEMEGDEDAAARFDDLSESESDSPEARGGDDDEPAASDEEDREAAQAEQPDEDDDASDTDESQRGAAMPADALPSVAAPAESEDDDGEDEAGEDAEASADHDTDEEADDEDESAEASDADEAQAADESGESSEDAQDGAKPARRRRRRSSAGANANGNGADKSRGAKRAELLERYKEARRKRLRIMRNYKIQEVIKRRQILLVQVVKEERGNKGAALTTYLSLAGRYCVLMPNTARGGGISRKIPVAGDRKRLRRVVDSLEVPQGMGLIIRTAGAKRTKAEIKRDYDYLLRLWENIRTLTLKSIAPCLIYEEASLIKRAIRDLYDKDIDLVLVEGETGYREAKDFMKMLMPSHAKNVQPYREKAPLFLKHDVESQLDAMFHPTVRLKSGGYIVIHQTEALIAIDVNSGKATRERNIELTALKTNIEAAKEAARQCRLRDLAGLIVIDFIDMEENKNNRAVEKRLKEALKVDRARIQVGRISNFGLLEMSRQRRRSGIIDGTTHACPTCAGAGVVRSHEMAALRILRAIEGSALTDRSAVIAVRASLDVTLYILNHKRGWLKRIEDDYAVTVEIVADPSKAGDQYDLEKRGAPRELPEAPAFVRPDQLEAVEAPEPEAAEEESAGESDAGEPGQGGRRKRRRRRRGRRDGAPASAEADAAGDDSEAAGGGEDADAENGDGEQAAQGEEGEGGRRRRRRGRRGGRRNRRPEGEQSSSEAAPGDANDDQSGPIEAETAAVAPAEAAEGESDGLEPREEAPAPVAETRRDVAEAEADAASDGDTHSPVQPEGDDIGDLYAEEGEETPAPDASDEPANDRVEDKEPALAESEPAPREDKPARKGWWQRAIGG